MVLKLEGNLFIADKNLIQHSTALPDYYKLK